jgi:hypothetical protein
MATVGTSTLRCPVCGTDLDVAISASPFERRSGTTMYLSFDLAQVRDHVAEHDLGSAVAVDLPLPTSSALDDPPVQCWHIEADSPCDWDICRQPERLVAGDCGTDPARGM